MAIGGTIVVFLHCSRAERGPAKVSQPRKTRRWLRTVKHHKENGKQMSLTDAQLAGWLGLENMVKNQAT